MVCLSPGEIVLHIPVLFVNKDKLSFKKPKAGAIFVAKWVFGEPNHYFFLILLHMLMVAGALTGLARK